jgi:hypothetical protein
MAPKHPPCPTVSFGVSAWPQVFRRLNLSLTFDHLIEERQTGHESDHRYEPGRARMRLHKPIDAVEVIDFGGVFDIGHVRCLMAIAKPHQRFVRPGIVVEHGDLDNARLERGMPATCGNFDRFQLAQEIVGLDDIGIELDLERGVSRTYFGNAANLRGAHRLRCRQALEEGFQRHRFVALNEDMFIASKRISAVHRLCSIMASCGFMFVTSHCSNHRV